MGATSSKRAYSAPYKGPPKGDPLRRDGGRGNLLSKSGSKPCFRRGGAVARTPSNITVRHVAAKTAIKSRRKQLLATNSRGSRTLFSADDISDVGKLAPASMTAEGPGTTYHVRRRQPANLPRDSGKSRRRKPALRNLQTEPVACLEVGSFGKMLEACTAVMLRTCNVTDPTTIFGRPLRGLGPQPPARHRENRPTRALEAKLILL